MPLLNQVNNSQHTTQIGSYHAASPYWCAICLKSSTRCGKFLHWSTKSWHFSYNTLQVESENSSNFGFAAPNSYCLSAYVIWDEQRLVNWKLVNILVYAVCTKVKAKTKQWAGRSFSCSWCISWEPAWCSFHEKSQSNTNLIMGCSRHPARSCGILENGMDVRIINILQVDQPHNFRMCNCNFARPRPQLPSPCQE